MSTRFNRIVTSFGLAAVLVASMLAGFAGTANASPSTMGGQGNVSLELCQPSEGSGQTWAKFFYADAPGWAVKNGKVITGTNEAGVANVYQLRTTVVDTVKGGTTVGGGGVDEGDYVVVLFNGTNVKVIPTFLTVVGGQSNTFGGYCGTTTAKAKTGTTKTTTAAAPTGTAMCLFATTSPITTTKTAEVIVGDTNDVFTGKLLFVLNGKAMTAEAALAAFNKDKKLGMERSFDGLAVGIKVAISSGNWRVFRIPTSGGKPMYLGDLDATPGGSFTKLTRVDGVCQPFDLKLAGSKGATTGAATDIIGWLMAIGAAFGLAFVNRRRFLPAFSFNR